MYDYRTISRSCLHEGPPLRSSLPLPSSLPLLPPSAIRRPEPRAMSSIGSPAKHFFPPPYSLQVSTPASQSARRRPVIDVNQGTFQDHPRVHSRFDSVRTFVSTGLPSPSESHPKLSSESSTCSTLVDNAVRAILL